MNTRLNITRLLNNLCDLDSVLDPLNEEYDPYRAEYEYNIIKPILEDLLKPEVMEEIRKLQIRFTTQQNEKLSDYEDQALSLKSLM